MKGYWIAKYKKAEDVKKLGSYAEKALKAITDFGGKPLVRGGKYITLEGEEFIRTVIWEFSDYNAALNSFNNHKVSNNSIFGYRPRFLIIFRFITI